MCVMSMVMDSRTDDWLRRYYIKPMDPYEPIRPIEPLPVPPPTPQEIEEFRRLLDRAREYDRRHGEPDCELEEKREKLRRMARELGVQIEFV